MSLIITIGRQFGSGGRDVGEKVAEYFNIPFYDKELVELAAQKSNISKEALKEVDEHATNSFLYSLASGNYSMRGINAPIYYEMPINDKLFIAQADVIKEVAKRGSCVIVGRCADYALEGYPNLLSVFIHADLDARIKRIAKKYDLTDAKAKDLIIKTNKKRASYYNYYTDKRWGDADSYDVCLDSSVLGLEGTAEAIIKLIEVKEKGIKRNIWQYDE